MAGGNIVVMEAMELYNRFRSVPDEAKKPISAGRLKGFTDINPMWRIKMLTERFGPVGLGWYYLVDREWTEVGSNGITMAFVRISLHVRYGDAWSMPIVGIGGSTFVAQEKGGLYTSDECFKMALTDAISISCKALGMGADVYFEKDRTKYDMENKTIGRTEYNCEDCGKSFQEFEAKGKKYTAGQAYHMAENLSSDKVARCKGCREKHKGEEGN